jgi:thiol-disulfide isomerase/thioredoxin
MLQTRRTWLILFLLTALLGGGWVVYSREPVQAERFTSLVEAPIVGHLAPDFTLTTPDGDSFTLISTIDRSSTAGKPVVLNFWATWCGPCRIEMPHMQATSEKYAGQVAIIGVNQMEPADRITDFAAEFGLTYPLLVDEQNVVNNLYGITSLPTTIFIDANGTVRELIIGTISQGVLEDRINKLLDE